MQQKPVDWRKLAAAIHTAATGRPIPQADLSLPMIAWKVCHQTVRRIEIARRRDWLLAAARLEQECRFQTRELRDALDALCARVSESEPVPRFALAHEIYQDLLALFDEFESVECDHRQRTLSAVTEPIELEGVYLGPFEIRFCWGQYARDTQPAYQIIAVDPRPAASRDSVTHPHVQSEALCEGDGRGPIQTALEQGRLLDFFVIVANILRTYNDGSPHVSLDDWYGVPCVDCGSSIAADERWSCEKCGDSLCDDCRVNCLGCDDIYCSGCVRTCSECGDSYCSGCLPRHQPNQPVVCRDCLDESEKDEPNDEEKPEQPAESPHAAVQSDGVGQAAVSA